MYTPDIIYEDADILICRKPAGIAVQTKRLGQQDMETGLKNYLVRKKEKPYIGIVHRLDQPVEGIMVFAKNPKAAAELSRQIQGREIGKYYYAIGCRTSNQKQEATGSAATGSAATRSESDIVSGASKQLPASGTLIDYLGFDAKKNLGYVSTAAEAAKDKNIKKAVLDYKVVTPDSAEANSAKANSEQTNSEQASSEKADPAKVCFDITLHTGRHHQIRLQLAHLGYPLLGDTKYGGPEAGQIALCSYRLNFRHPNTGKNMDLRILPSNPAFADYLNKCI